MAEVKWIEISVENVLYVDPDLTEPVAGIKAYLRRLEPFEGKIKYDASEYVNPRVAINGKTAMLTYNYHSLQKNPKGGFRRTSSWNTTEVYRWI